MGRCVKHEGCVNCGSRDNVGVYEDGGKFCFGCHWWSQPDSTGKLETISARRFLDAYERVKDGVSVVQLPIDYTVDIPPWGNNWLMQYLTNQEIAEHHIGYSENYNRIIFPIYDKKLKLLAWIGRGKEGDFPKYLTMGRRTDALDVISSNVLSERVVVVEDRISAIRVSGVCSSVSLFGSHMPLEWARTLSKTFSGLVIWLDPDKKAEAFKQAVQLSPFFRRGVKVILSKEDPKCYFNMQIAHLLGSA